MQIQNQVVLSLGSNQGNRLENIQNAIALIHKKIGTVIRVSKLYETPSWGFESDVFYNCALLLHTSFSAEKILEKILDTEKHLGRTRSELDGYQARIIDIDIVSFNEEIYETASLHIPHPRMQNRLFVLLPVLDLKPDWIHPKLNKSVSELIKITDDKSDCKAVGDLNSPLSNFNPQRFNYIAIEGNIGAGKTALSTKISEDFNAKLVLEHFVDNSFLAKFYKDQNRYAFSLEMSFLVDRHQQLSDTLAQFASPVRLLDSCDLRNNFVVADYHILKSLIFAKITLAEDEFSLYETLFKTLTKELQKPDLYVYLHQNTERLLTNIKQRGRLYEQNIQADYLEKINQGYLNYIKTQTDLNVLIIDISDMDFVNNQEDYLKILDAIISK